MSNYSTMNYNPPEIEGMSDDDVFRLAEMIVSALTDAERDFGFMQEYHTRLSENMYMNSHMDDLISDTVDALDAYDGWRSEAKAASIVVENAMFRGAEFIVNRYGNRIEREFNDRELDAMDEILNNAPRKHVSARRQPSYPTARNRDYEPQRQAHSLGSGRNLYDRDHGNGRRRNGNYDGRTPIYQTGSQTTRDRNAPQRDIYGRVISHGNRQPQRDELYARNTYHRDGRVNISGISRGQPFNYNTTVRPSERGNPRRGLEMEGIYGDTYNGNCKVSINDYLSGNYKEEDLYPNHKPQHNNRSVDISGGQNKNTYPFEKAPVEDGFEYNAPQPKPKQQAKKSQPKGEKPVTFKGVTLIHQNAKTARKYVCRSGGLLVAPKGSEVFYKEDSGEPVTVPQGEIKLDKSLHRTEQFFKDWIGTNDSRDPEQTKQALDALQKRKIISVLEEQLAAKYEVDKNDQSINTELFGSMIYINDHGVVSSEHTSATIAEANDVLSSVIKAGSVLDGKPFDYMCVNYLSRSVSDWLISADDKSARNVFGEMPMHTKITDIKDMILNAQEHLPQNIVVDLNDRATKWLNRMLHRYWNCAVDCVDSFVGDIDELMVSLDRLGITKESFEAVYRRNKDTLFNLVTLDKAKLEKYGLEYEEGSQVLMEYIDVTKIAVSSREFDLMVDKTGRGVVNAKVHPELYKALDAIVNKTQLDIVDSVRPKEYVIITSDNKKMYVTKISRDSIVISRY